jgi:LmbE family N-acetylglucosaminyl deacetylase
MFALDRVLIVAPHPDDETLATGGVIQRAGDVRIVIVTDGEMNPWPQRVTYKKWRINDSDRAQWGMMRRDESLCALAKLGASDHCARFLALPDTMLMTLARRGDKRFADAIAKEISSFAPTLIITPSSFDLHADHRAAACIVHKAAANMDVVTYVVHGSGDPSRIAMTVELTDAEKHRKRSAIECHASQLRLSRKRFITHATMNEVFFAAEHERVRIESEEEERRGWRMHMRHVLRRYV